MRTFRVLKGVNPIMELCIAYGLCKILDDSGIKWELTNKLSQYRIDTEDFNSRDAFTQTLTEHDFWVINRTLRLNEKIGRINAANCYFDNEDNMERLFSYYETLDETYLAGCKKSGATFSGTGFYSKGIRGTSTAKAEEIYDFENALALLGFLSAATYISANYEINALYVPRKTNQILRPYAIPPIINKETGERKIITRLSDKPPKQLIDARIYLRSLKSLKSDLKIENVQSILFMQMANTGNKPMSDKTFELTILDLSLDLVEAFIKKVEYSTGKDDVKLAVSRFVLSPTYPQFTFLMQMFAKHDVLLEENLLQELINLLPQDVRTVYLNPSIRKVASALYRLNKKKNKGYDIQVKLMGCHSFLELSNILTMVNVLHARVFENSALSNEDVEIIVSLASDNQTIRVIANAILTYSSVYCKKKVEEGAVINA